MKRPLLACRVPIIALLAAAAVSLPGFGGEQAAGAAPPPRSKNTAEPPPIALTEYHDKASGITFGLPGGWTIRKDSKRPTLKVADQVVGGGKQATIIVIAGPATKTSDYWTVDPEDWFRAHQAANKNETTRLIDSGKTLVGRVHAIWIHWEVTAPLRVARYSTIYQLSVNRHDFMIGLHTAPRDKPWYDESARALNAVIDSVRFRVAEEPKGANRGDSAAPPTGDLPGAIAAKEQHSAELTAEHTRNKGEAELQIPAYGVGPASRSGR